ncbi:isocitrate lyase/PEP mutase family protein [Longitalea luteola]|uniref:isocitrate lyase/PEP mutase family protein n=1 Tax=Longitalea luteola TaxID=2812563 RepID=UPI001A97A1C2|nr:isocitrate lyase/phosphoenolpyruvate mutase family protein [Longitalea luteola]
MTSSFQQFKELHYSPELLVLPNAWNAKSAQLVQQENYPAVATSSAAVANSLGYDDGEAMPFDEYLLIIRRITATVQIPVTVDLEMGYGNTDEAIYANIRKLIDTGVAGINIEDSMMAGSARVLQDAKTFANRIAFIKNKLAADGLEIFINIRCDTYLLKVANPQAETAARLLLYGSSGADGIFLPFISKEADIAAAVKNTKLPINVMCIPGLPDFDILQQLGVKRVSMGPFLFNKVYNQAPVLVRSVQEAKNFGALLN